MGLFATGDGKQETEDESVPLCPVPCCCEVICEICNTVLNRDIVHFWVRMGYCLLHFSCSCTVKPYQCKPCFQCQITTCPCRPVQYVDGGELYEGGPIGISDTENR